MISTISGGGAGPVAGYIAARFSASSPYFRLFTYRKRGLVIARLAGQPATDIGTSNSGEVMRAAFSSGASYLAVAVATTFGNTGFRIYSRSGSTFTALSPSGTVTGAHVCVSMSADGTYIATSSKVYHNNAGSLTLLTTTGVTARNAISPDGVWIAARSGTATDFDICKRSGSGSTATYAIHETKTGLNTGEDLNAASFSPDGAYLMVGTDVSPRARAYKYDAGGDTWNALSNQPPSGGTLPDATVEHVAWADDSTLVALSTSQKTFIYERSGDTFTHRATITGTSNNAGYTCSFHPSGNYIAVGGDVLDGAKIYKKNSVTSWTLLTRPSEAGTNATIGATFSPYI